MAPDISRVLPLLIPRVAVGADFAAQGAVIRHINCAGDQVDGAGAGGCEGSAVEVHDTAIRSHI